MVFCILKSINVCTFICLCILYKNIEPISLISKVNQYDFKKIIAVLDIKNNMHLSSGKMILKVLKSDR